MDVSTVTHSRFQIVIAFRFRRALIYMFPFNVINWVKMVLLSGVMSACLGAVFMGIRWKYWDRAWQASHIFEQDNISK